MVGVNRAMRDPDAWRALDNTRAAALRVAPLEKVRFLRRSCGASEADRDAIDVE